MSIRPKLFVLLPLLLGFFAAQIVQAASSPPGTQNNPLVAKSYIEKTLQPLRKELSALEVELATLKAQKDVQFNDVTSSHWAYKQIMYMVSKDIVKGMKEKIFAPEEPTTRAQLAVMIVNALKLPTEGLEAEFSDVQPSHWAYRHIAAAQKAGIIQGNEGRFRPNDSVTRGEMAAMLVRAFKLERLEKAAEFSDVAEGYWAYDLIMRVADNGISRGYPDGSFKPAAKVKRAEVCVFLTLSLDPSQRVNE